MGALTGSEYDPYIPGKSVFPAKGRIFDMNAQEKIRDTGSEPPLHSEQAAQNGGDALPASASEQPDEIKVCKAVVTKDPDTSTVAEVFTMTIGTETIQLLPLKHWMQLDIHKWRARGILPRTPAGLEITWDHVKVADATITPWEADACVKLQAALNKWLAVEKQALALAREKAQAPQSQNVPAETDDEVVHFQVEMGPLGQPRLKCLEGRKVVKTVALNLQGLNALIEQGLMRKPRSMKVGALHDWIELDGELFRFKEGTDWERQLEATLNERYIVTGEGDAVGDVAVFPNPASPTGFDIQFTASPSGFVETRKRHLNEETVNLLQDPERCHVLRKGVIAKFTPPNLVFKQKTTDGGECYLEPGLESTVSVVGEDGQIKTIDLSQPVSLLNIGVRELTAVFNHPAINRRARLAEAAADRAGQ